MTQSFFITGTDTGVGKTWATVTLMHYFKNQGKSVLGIKPVASGCVFKDGELKNQDALLLQENASFPIEYQFVNPFAYELAVSPHLATTDNPVDVEKIATLVDELKLKTDILLVEGVGGWLVPLNDRGQDVADLAKRLQIPVIMVVAIRLGCINHARLTFHAIQNSGLICAGWIAVCVDPTMDKQAENINTLKKAIQSSLLGVLPYRSEPDFEYLAQGLDKKIMSS